MKRTTSVTPTFDGRKFRTVLGHFPTGVAVVTALDTDGNPVGMAVGSFTSVSLDPPLVAFLPDKGSSSFPKIRDAAAFCVNVLAAEQEDVCRQFAAKGADKFAGLGWEPGPSTGSPVLDGVVAWMDCEMGEVIDAGDHYIVLGQVMELDVANADLPLLFFQGGYGRFAPATLVAPQGFAVATQLRWADLARAEMESLASQLDLGCLAASVVGEEMLILASTGRPGSGLSPTQVGQRIPFVAPFGALWLAWADDVSFEAWVRRAGTTTTTDMRAEYQEAVARVKQRGWSIGLGDKSHSELEAILAESAEAEADPARQRRLFELSEKLGSRYEPAELSEGELYDVRNISAPVLDESGEVVLTLTLYAFQHRLQTHEIEEYQERLVSAATRVSAAGKRSGA